MSIAGLYVLSIPWYRSGGDETGTLLGLPSWAGVAILCYLAAAILNAFAWLLTDIPDAPPDEAGDGDCDDSGDSRDDSGDCDGDAEHAP